MCTYENKRITNDYIKRNDPEGRHFWTAQCIYIGVLNVRYFVQKPTYIVNKR